MKIFLSALNSESCDYLVSKGVKFKWNLLSFFQICGGSPKAIELFRKILDNSDEVLIDSEAHSFQKGMKVDWDDYTRKYCEFIRAYDCPKIIGYFEMDVDNIIGYPKVLQLRREIESVTNKVIPVWHNNRGISEYKKMCEQYSGRIVAVTGFKNAEFKDEQYPMFVKEAWKNRCRIHCLGLTRKEVLKRVPFDYTDSSTWLQQMVYGTVYNPTTKKHEKVTLDSTRNHRRDCSFLNYLGGIEMQETYYNYWRRYNGHYNNDWR